MGYEFFMALGGHGTTESLYPGRGKALSAEMSGKKR
jgi:hypothetical protein